MADTHAHTPEPEETPFGPRRIVAEFTDGGHEIDRPPNVALFGVIGAMAVVIILAAVGVYQLFITEAEADNAKVSSQPSMLVRNQAARDAEFFTTWGQVVRDGKVVGYRMPIPQAKALVLASPDRFKAAPATPGGASPNDAKP